MTQVQLSELHTRVLLAEVELQCRLASVASERLASSVQRSDSLEVWGALQSVLVAAANVSRILWPQKRFEERGTYLRSLLGLEVRHPLADRTLRNRFEHYDERIDEWFSTIKSAVYTDQYIGELSGFHREFPQNVHRHFDPRSMTVNFRGESLDLAQLLESLADVLRRTCVALYGTSGPVFRDGRF